mmetsp:Transcript_33297/g.30245  ORF Transcript_33297/g.30245 Transcript_33297/m.30245 type:complete len:202 (+) Transcript_33297:282-887(+)
MGEKVYKENLSEYLRKMATKSVITDQELQKTLNKLVERPLLEGSGDPMDDSLNMFCNKLLTFCAGFNFFNRKNKEFNETTRRVQEGLDQKVNEIDFKTKLKKKKKKLESKISLFHSSLEERISELEKKMNDRMDKFTEKVVEVEKSTIWKIKDCEDLLRTRVNEKYVENAINKSLALFKEEVARIETDNKSNIKDALIEAT